MPAAQHDITFEQGAKFLQEFVWQEPSAAGLAAGDDIDPENDDHWTSISLTGRAARMKVKTKKTGGTTLFTLVSTGVNPAITLEPEAQVGVIRVEVGATQTATLTRGGVYDLEIYVVADPESVDRLIEGKANLSLEVTDG